MVPGTSIKKNEGDLVVLFSETHSARCFKSSALPWGPLWTLEKKRGQPMGRSRRSGAPGPPWFQHQAAGQLPKVLLSWHSHHHPQRGLPCPLSRPESEPLRDLTTTCVFFPAASGKNPACKVDAPPTPAPGC